MTERLGALWARALCCIIAWCVLSSAQAAESVAPQVSAFPQPLESYGDSQESHLGAILRHRAEVQPLNVWVTVLFGLAIVHTFLASRVRRLAHQVEARHKARWWDAVREAEARGEPAPRETASIQAGFMHFLGEVEVVFGLWAVPLLILITWTFGSSTTVQYLERLVHFEEPLFVVVIMALASTRPVLEFAERALRAVAALGRGTPVAWWFSILTVGPLLGSFITEPGAMTISAMLLARQFYRLSPSPRLAYATLGLLFVNISVGGTLTHFAAPPVLMVAAKWGWGSKFMTLHFGWQSTTGILLANVLVFLVLRREFNTLGDAWEAEALGSEASAAVLHPVPIWITAVHILAMAWSVLTSHHPVLLVGGFLFFLAFYTATEDFQGRLDLRGPILVGFFLAGLVIHGGLQPWWIAPMLSGLGERALFVMGAVLTAFNDNAAITYLASLVPGFSETMKHAIVAGAVTGGGLTVIANAPNPAGQSILAKYFPNGISPLGLLLGALGPTLIVGACLMLLPH